MNDGCLMGCRPAIGVHRIDCPNAGVVTHRESREQSESLSPDRVALQEAERALREAQPKIHRISARLRAYQTVPFRKGEYASFPTELRLLDELAAALAAAAAPSGEPPSEQEQARWPYGGKPYEGTCDMCEMALVSVVSFADDDATTLCEVCSDALRAAGPQPSETT